MSDMNRGYPLLMMGLMILLLISQSPASAISVTGAKYMGNAGAGDTVTHVITVSTTATDPSMDIVIDTWGFGQTRSKSYSPLSAAEDTSPYLFRALNPRSVPISGPG